MTKFNLLITSYEEYVIFLNFAKRLKLYTGSLLEYSGSDLAYFVTSSNVYGLLSEELVLKENFNSKLLPVWILPTIGFDTNKKEFNFKNNIFLKFNEVIQDLSEVCRVIKSWVHNVFISKNVENNNYLLFNDNAIYFQHFSDRIFHINYEIKNKDYTIDRINTCIKSNNNKEINNNTKTKKKIMATQVSKTSSKTSNLSNSYFDKLKSIYMPTKVSGLAMSMTGEFGLIKGDELIVINDNGELTSYPKDMCLDFPTYVIRKNTKDLKQGDIFKINDSFYKFFDLKDNKIKAISYNGTSVNKIVATDALLQMKTVEVVWNMTQNNGNINPMMFALMGEENDMSSLLMMSAMSGNGDMNSMLPMLLLSKGNNDMNSMLPLMMMNGGMNIPFGQKPVEVVKEEKEDNVVNQRLDSLESSLSTIVNMLEKMVDTNK